MRKELETPEKEEVRVQEARRRRGDQRGHVLPAAFVSQPHLSLDCPASAEPLCAALVPSGDLLLLQKQSLAGDGVGLDMMSGWGQREHASAQSMSAQPDSAHRVSGRPGWFSGNQWPRRGASFSKGEAPSTRKYKKLIIIQEIPHSSAS